MRKAIGFSVLMFMLFGNRTPARGQEPIAPIVDVSHITVEPSLTAPTIEAASQQVQPAKAPQRKRLSLKATLITLAVVAGVVIVVYLSVPST